MAGLLPGESKGGKKGEGEKSLEWDLLSDVGRKEEEEEFLS